MSKRMCDTFFPACLDTINRDWIMTLVYHKVIFPESIAKECPEYVWNINNSWTIRQPCLLVAALWGAWIGYQGFVRFQKEKQFTWAVALLAFGIMNVSAVCLHCLWRAPVIDYPTDYPIFWVIDTYMTGVSGACLFMAALDKLQNRWTRTTTTDQKELFSPLLKAVLRRLPVPKLLVAVQLVGILCILWFMMDPAPQVVAASHPLELWYLVPPIAAGTPILLVVFEDVWVQCYESYFWPQNPTSLSALPPLSLGQVIFALSILVAGVLGVAMDRVWCPLVGYSLARDFLSANTLVFLGCDLAFWGLERFLLQRQRHLDDAATARQKSSIGTKKKA